MSSQKTDFSADVVAMVFRFGVSFFCTSFEFPCTDSGVRHSGLLAFRVRRNFVLASLARLSRAKISHPLYGSDISQNVLRGFVSS